MGGIDDSIIDETSGIDGDGGVGAIEIDPIDIECLFPEELGGRHDAGEDDRAIREGVIACKVGVIRCPFKIGVVGTPCGNNGLLHLFLFIMI